MRRLAALLALAGALVVPATATASTAPIQECGNYGWHHDRHGYHSGWTYGRIDGAGVVNVTTRTYPCWIARSYIARRGWSSRPMPSGWRCRYQSLGFEYGDHRCTRGSQVVRYQTGA